MANDINELTNTVKSRRGFLVKLGLGVAALASMSTILAGVGRVRASETSDEFPGPDSIFHPARDPRFDPRRNQ